MNLESGRVILDSYRVIGIKDTDKEKLVQAALRKESSFVSNNQVVSEPMIQNQPIVEVVPEIMPEATVMPNMAMPEVQVQPEGTPIMEQIPIKPNTVDNSTNMFVNPGQAPEVEAIAQVEPINSGVNMNPMGFEQPQFVQPQMVNEDIQGGVPLNNPTELETPQNFFDRVEQPIINQNVENNQVVQEPSYVNEDPAIIMLDNLRKVVDDKNEMIKVLNNKIGILEDQIRNLEEAKKVSDAQRVAAETTLANARNASGPTLVYQQQPGINQNYGQAA